MNLRDQFPTLAPVGKRMLHAPRAIGRGIKWLFLKTYKYTLALLLVLAIVHGVATIVFGRRVEAKLAALKAAGNPISCAEFGLPKVPDNENAAILYDKAFKVIKTPKEGDDSRILDEFLDPKNSSDAQQNWNDARALLARCRGAFPLVEQAVARPKCQFPVKWENGFEALFPHYAPLRKLNRFLVVNAIVQAHDGDMDGAVRSIDLGLRMNESIANDPTLIAQLVRIAMIAISTHSLQHVLQYGEISEVQAAHLSQTLGSIDMVPGYIRAMQGERAFGIWTFDYVHKRTNVIGSLFSYDGGISNKPPHLGWRLLGYVWRPILYADEMYYLRHMDKVTNLVRRPYREAKSEYENSIKQLDIPQWAVMSRIILPIFSRARMKADEASVRIGGSQIALALKVYKQRYGSYPETLDDLRAKVGWEIPQDVFSGKDFVYKRQGNGFLLYSIGENLKDDGGRETPSEARNRTPADKLQDDIIWEFDR